jgi:Zn-dependent peptidase ImmA (M78 family)|tara:strand:- start:7725 stop:8045 length:321 start_codon:yes stop_codon:yes gene_type:complete
MIKNKKSRDTRIAIGGHEYEVIFTGLRHEDSTKELYGRHEVKDNIIYINENIHPSRQKETLIHEILHALHFNYGLQHSEGYIDALSNGLFQLGMGDYLWKKIQKKS